MKRIGVVLIDCINFMKRDKEAIKCIRVSIAVIFTRACIKVERNSPEFFCELMPDLQVRAIDIIAAVYAG